MITQPVRQIIRESQEFARSSEVVAEAVGTPVAVADAQDPIMPSTYQDGDAQIQEWRFAVEGSQAKGDLVVKIAMTPPLNYERKSLTLELDDGTVVALDMEEEFNLDIDLGDDPSENE